MGYVNLTWVVQVALASSHMHNYENQYNADKKSPDPLTHLLCCIIASNNIMTAFIVLINDHNIPYKLVPKNN